METIIKIDGMSCHHCVAAVKKALDGIDGIIESDISVGTAKVSFDDSRTGHGTITEAIKNAGYRVI